MVYPSKGQTRYVAGLTLVVVLVGTAGYVVTRTDSTERMSVAGARTQDISLPGPAVSTSAPGYSMLTTRGIGYVGAASGGPSAAPVEEGKLASIAYGGFLPGPAVSESGDRFAGGSRDFSGGSFISPRVHSAGGSGFSGGSMGGHSAWGGVSGHVPAGSGIAAAATAPRLAFKSTTGGATGSPKTTSSPRSSGGSVAGASGVISTEVAAATTLVADAGTTVGTGGGTFTGGTGGSGGDPGSVPPPAGGGSGGGSPGSSPTPEPLSILLVGTGLAGLYQVRRHLH